MMMMGMDRLKLELGTVLYSSALFGAVCVSVEQKSLQIFDWLLVFDGVLVKHSKKWE